MPHSKSAKTNTCALVYSSAFPNSGVEANIYPLKENRDKPLCALVVEGGAMRSVFSAGVLDAFLDQSFNPFDFYIGVSAGAFNLVTYLGESPEHSLRMFMQYARDKKFIQFTRYLRGGHLLDLDWLIATALKASNSCVDNALADGRALYVTVTEVETGLARLIRLDRENIELALKASMALPQIYRSFPCLDGCPLTDGGVADGIPLEPALRLGATRIMVIRSRHKNYHKRDGLAHKLIRWRLKNYQSLCDTLRRRVEIHRKNLALIRNPPAGVEIVEVCPPQAFSIGRFNRRRSDLMRGYYAGWEQAQLAMVAWSDPDAPINRPVDSVI